ncbi:hypothetical protein FA95DRAFT_1451696, partial [Auriscalpium vulgare]
LDIEGAFPNAVTDRLLHNMRARRVPGVLIDFVHRMLTHRRTSLRFDDYTSGIINIDNGIGQGDPLSMALYLYYNAGILDIPRGRDEAAMAFVDDAIIFAT